MQSFILYHGPAMLPYKGIITVVVFLSDSNPKTGTCIAVAILPGDGKRAMSDRKRGLDISVCGVCPFRSIASGGKGGCYVSAFALMGYAGSASAAWKRADPYAMPESTIIPMRLGAYGDPAAIPVESFQRLMDWHGGSCWGYTHGWRHSAAQHLRTTCMASVETGEHQAHAMNKGWRVYRIVASLQDIKATGLTLCESAKGIECIACGACSGTDARHDKGRAIVVHGASHKRAASSLA